MEAMLLATMLTCAEGRWLLGGVNRIGTLTGIERAELRVEIIASMPDYCSPKDYNPPGRK